LLTYETSLRNSSQFLTLCATVIYLRSGNAHNTREVTQSMDGNLPNAITIT